MVHESSIFEQNYKHALVIKSLTRLKKIKLPIRIHQSGETLRANREDCTGNFICFLDALDFRWSPRTYGFAWVRWSDMNIYGATSFLDRGHWSILICFYNAIISFSFNKSKSSIFPPSFFYNIWQWEWTWFIFLIFHWAKTRSPLIA